MAKSLAPMMIFHLWRSSQGPEGEMRPADVIDNPADRRNPITRVDVDQQQFRSVTPIAPSHRLNRMFCSIGIFLGRKERDVFMRHRTCAARSSTTNTVGGSPASSAEGWSRQAV
jgi:hypothetical protein